MGTTEADKLILDRSGCICERQTIRTGKETKLVNYREGEERECLR